MVLRPQMLIDVLWIKIERHRFHKYSLITLVPEDLPSDATAAQHDVQVHVRHVKTERLESDRNRITPL